MPAMPPPEEFDLERFLPYLLNQAAEATSRDFQATYRATYGLTRTQWRVMANLGKFGAMTARDICAISHIEKTKVSRAVAALGAAGLIDREASPTDRRAEFLSLTGAGQNMFRELGRRAMQFDEDLRRQLGSDLADQLDRTLRNLISLGSGAPEED